MRRNTNPAGGFEKDVGRGFLARDVFARHKRVEQREDAQMLEHLSDDLFGAAGGDRHWYFPMVLPRDPDHDIDRLDLVDEGQVFRLFFQGHQDGIKRHALFATQHFEDVAGRHAAQFVESFFRELESMPPGDGLPGAPVERHCVRQRAVAVKDDSLGHRCRFGLQRFEFEFGFDLGRGPLTSVFKLETRNAVRASPSRGVPPNRAP